MRQFNYIEIAEKIKSRREELGYSLQDLADRTGMSKSTLQRYETGSIQNIPITRLKALSESLELDVRELVGLPNPEINAISSVIIPMKIIEIDYEMLGGILDVTRKQRNYSHAQVANLMDIDEQTVLGWIAGTVAMNINDTLQKLCSVLGLDYSVVIDEISKKTPDYANIDYITPEEVQMVHDFRYIDFDAQQIIRDILKREVKNAEIKNDRIEHEIKMLTSQSIPEVYIAARDGGGFERVTDEKQAQNMSKAIRAKIKSDEKLP